jgi:hypothetical protein
MFEPIPVITLFQLKSLWVLVFYVLKKFKIIYPIRTKTGVFVKRRNFETEIDLQVLRMLCKDEDKVWEITSTNHGMRKTASNPLEATSFP